MKIEKADLQFSLKIQSTFFQRLYLGYQFKTKWLPILSLTIPKRNFTALQYNSEVRLYDWL